MLVVESMTSRESRVYAFGPFRLDVEKRRVISQSGAVGLTPKAFDLLLALVEQKGRVVSKEALMRRVWADRFVEENNLAQTISALRKSLRENGDDANYVENIPKRGYRFAAQVETVGESALPGGAGLRRLAPRTRYARSTGDANIAYQVVGDGPIDLVFVMGWVSHLECFWQEPSFARFLSRLAGFSRLILLDKRGTGLSDRVAVDDLPTLEQRMTDVQAVMDAVGSERAALLGVSEGGPMCSLFAATYPERTTALAMIGTYAKRVRTADYPWAPTEGEREQFLERLEREWGTPVGIETRAPSRATDPEFRDWWAQYLRLGASPGAALALTRMNSEIDVRSVLPSIRVPTLVLHRTADACLPVEGGRYVASRIPNAKFVELDGEDHLPFVGDQDAILDEIEIFLTGARPERRVDTVLTTVLSVVFDGDGGEAHRAHVRRELALFRGTEVEFEGDRWLATFDGPARAIRCARAIADATHRLGLRVRVGLHTGECDVSGERLGGNTVHIADALARLAAPGEALVSHTVKNLVAGSGIEMDSRGERAFPGLPGEWHLFAAGRGAGR